jgi:hypothetical protein
MQTLDSTAKKEERKKKTASFSSIIKKPDASSSINNDLYRDWLDLKLSYCCCLKIEKHFGSVGDSKVARGNVSPAATLSKGIPLMTKQKSFTLGLWWASEEGP